MASNIIRGTNRADNLSNDQNGMVILALGGNDTITNTGNNDGRNYLVPGDDYHGHNVSIDAGKGNDLIRNDQGNDVTISAGAGKDSIYSYHGYRVILDGGDGNDSIAVSHGHLTTARGGLGNDTIVGQLARDDATESNWTFGGYAYISGGDGDDYISPGYSDHSKIYGGAGNDFIELSGEYTTISGGAGNDTILNENARGKILAGDGDDYIQSTGNRVTITGGQGNDTISISGKKNLLVYNLTDGNDLIKGFNADDTLRIGDGTGGYFSRVKGDDVIVRVAGNYITLKGAANLNLNIQGTLTDNQTEADRATAVSLNNLSFRRTDAGYPVLAGIAFSPEELYGPEPTNYSSKDTWTINSSDGLKLNGYYYAPEISNDKWVILIHGYGLDHKCMYPFATVYLANGYNVLLVDQRAAGTSEGTWLTMGNGESADIALWTQEIARRYPSSKITLHGVSMGSATAMLAAARSDTVNVTSLVEDCGYSDIMEVVKKLGENIPLLGAMLNDNVLKFMDTSSTTMTGYQLSLAAPINSISSVKMPTLFITGEADSVISPTMLDELYDASGASVKEKFLVAGAGHAMAASLDPVGYSNTLLRFVAEADGEGWTTENTVESISLRGTIYDDNFTNSGANVSISAGKGHDTIINSGAASKIFGGADEDLIISEGDSVTISGGDSEDLIASSGANVSISGGKGSDFIFVDGQDNTIKTGDGNDVIVLEENVTAVKLEDFSANDVLCLAEDVTNLSSANDSLVVAAGEQSVTVGGLSKVASISGAWKLNGTRASYVQTRSKGAYIDDGAVMLGTKSNSSTLLVLDGIGDTNMDVMYDTANIYPENFAGDSVKVVSNDGDLKIFAGGLFNKKSLIGSKGNDTINFQGTKLTIKSSAGDDLITNAGSSTKIYGGAGNDTILSDGEKISISGNAGNDVISLRGGSAVISYATGDGNDSIYGLTTNDTLKLSSGYSFKASGKNFVFTVGDGKITVQGAANLSGVHVNKSLLLTNKTSKNFTADSTTKAFNASARTTAIKITGNDLDNTIRGGSKNDSLFGQAGNDSLFGNAGNDSLWGGAGNDTLFGGDGSDVFIYKPNEGKDHITDFTSDDMLKILKTDGSQGSFTNSGFKSGNLTLTISGGGQVIFDNVSASDTFNINGTSYTIRNGKLK